MKYPLYQTTWHGLALAPSSEVASAPTYADVYARQKSKGFATDEGWMPAKKKEAAIFFPLLQDYQPALSIGAGLGVIESHLADMGLHIDLQECQGESLDWFRTHAKHPSEARIYESSDLSIIPAHSYAGILCVSVVYVFSDAQYIDFLHQCRRILRPKGRMIIWCHDAHLPLGWLKMLVTRKKAASWGWVRSPSHHRKLAVEAGFRVLSSSYFNADHEPFEGFSPRIAGVQLSQKGSHAQMHVLESGDA